MNFLFDVSPDEPPADKRKSKKRRQEAAPEAAVESGQFVYTPSKREKFAIIGRSENEYECADERCGGSCFDILDEYRGEWFIECVFCGTGQFVPAISGVIAVPDESGEFVFADGKFEGRTVAQAAGMEHGQQYISWAAQNHKREAVRNACRKWLDATSQPQ